jgi:peptidoglycan hydrolase-like protein with peptidoglycan-binding domain
MLSVKQRQLNLRTHCAYYMGAIDGIQGNGTKRAYLNFQRDNGLVADGIYGPATETKLIEVIRNLQQLLCNKGYKIAIDGLVGNGTLNALKDFQSKNGLPVDGIAGMQTYAKLNGSTPTPQPSKYTCKYFKDSEFKCPCCGLNLEKNGIKQIADEIREHFGRPAIITSGTRCVKHNREVGGVAGSYHTTGNAIDIVVTGIPGSEVLAYCKQIVAQGRARYTYGGTSQMGNATHIDTGGKE